jgi:hypothetical protein
MTGSPRRGSRLERGYRRLLAFYPTAYRRVHAEEMLAVVMTAAREGQRRPVLADAAPLAAESPMVNAAGEVEAAWN